MTTVVTTDYVLAADTLISAVDRVGLSVEGSAWRNVILSGDIAVTVTSDVHPVGGIMIEAGDSQARTVQLTPTAALSVDMSTLDLAVGVSVLSGGGITLANEGAVTVHSQGEAWGAEVGPGGFVNRGTLSVDAPGNVVAVVMDRGGSFENSGTIVVTGGGVPFSGAVGVRLRQTDTDFEFVNSGTIKATQVGPAHASVGVAISGYTTLVNHGLIEGDYALQLSRDSVVSGDGRISDVTNTGTLRGAVFLNNTAFEPVVLRNSGVIDGAVTLNNGADTYSGEAGIALGVVHGDEGGDVLRGGAGPETLNGDGGFDTVDGGAGDDVLNGGQGDDRIDGGAGANYLRGEDGNDLVIGGVDFDNINGNTGQDTVSGGGGADWVLGGQGGDQVSGDVGDDILNGNLGDDSCSGGDGADSVRGGQGADVLSGGAGEDHLFGDRGNDTLTGGAGGDVFHLGAAGGQDRVVDFSGWQSDRVQVDGGVSYEVAQVGSDTVVTLSTGDQLVLVGVHSDALLSGWIISG